MKREAEIGKLQQTDPKDRYFTRMMLQNATDAELDGQYRIVLPKELIQYANIESDVFILLIIFYPLSPTTGHKVTEFQTKVK